MKPKPILIFDIGGVLYENIGFDVLQQLMGDKPAQEVRDIWLNSKTVDQFETGKISPDIFAESIVRELGFELSPQQFIEKFVTWPKGFYKGAPELIATLREHYTVGCFSNSNVLHWRDEFDDLFDFALASHRTGVAKPKPAAFDLLNKTLHEIAGTHSNPAYFFDDSETNIKAGMQAGLKAVLTYGFDEVMRVLDQEGIRH